MKSLFAVCFCEQGLHLDAHNEPMNDKTILITTWITIASLHITQVHNSAQNSPYRSLYLPRFMPSNLLEYKQFIITTTGTWQQLHMMNCQSI